jgi:hypothetical protein
MSWNSERDGDENLPQAKPRKPLRNFRSFTSFENEIFYEFFVVFFFLT